MSIVRSPRSQAKRPRTTASGTPRTRRSANVRNAGPDAGAGAGTRPRPSSHAAPRAARTRDSRKSAAVSAGVTISRPSETRRES
jgi:hypothetical protein